MNLHQKLVEVRKILPYFQKDTPGFNYKYVKGSSILFAIKEKMNELSILLFPKISDYEIDRIDAGKKSKKDQNVTEFQFVFKSKISSIVIIDAETGETLEIPFAFVGSQDSPDKAYGSALTYAERYFLLKFFNIPTDEDDPDKFAEKNEDKKPRDFDSEILDIYEKCVKKGVFDDSDKGNIDFMIKSASTNSDKEAVLKTLHDYFAKQPIKKIVEDLQTSIAQGLGRLKYEETHRKNSVLKHLGTVVVSDCTDVNLLKKYYEHLRDEYRKAQNEKK